MRRAARLLPGLTDYGFSGFRGLGDGDIADIAAALPRLRMIGAGRGGGRAGAAGSAVGEGGRVSLLGLSGDGYGAAGGGSDGPRRHPIAHAPCPQSALVACPEPDTKGHIEVLRSRGGGGGGGGGHTSSAKGAAWPPRHAHSRRVA